MAQHTPGPWSPFDTEGNPVNDPSVFSDKHVIATVWINDLSRKHAVANAHLIAAAPDLLDVARRFVDHFSKFAAPDNEIACELLVRAGDAIAKAESK